MTKHVKIARFFVALCLLTGLSFGATAARAQELTLKELPDPQSKLLNQYEVNKPYVLKLEYTDPDGDKIDKAQFVEERPTQLTHDYKSIEGDVTKGATVKWEVNGFEKGGHEGYFLIKNKTGKSIRYPDKDKGNYTFAVTSLTDLWLKTLIGIFVCLIALPFLVYVIARSANKQGDPSRAARFGLMLGIIGAAAVFLVNFFGVYDYMVLGLGAIAAVALLVIVMTRR